MPGWTQTKIEWAQVTWNPITGCTPVSEGCKNCYAIKMGKRLAAMGVGGYDENFSVYIHMDRMEEPLRHKKGKLVFCCSMSDLFHKDVPDKDIERVFDVMAQARQHVFVVLTKRADRMWEWGVNHGFPPNAWVGVSVENERRVRERMPRLLACGHDKLVVSYEPALWRIGTEFLRGMVKPGWVICGAETGIPSWYNSFVDEFGLDVFEACKQEGVPFFFKKNRDGSRLLGGQVIEQYPDSIPEQMQKREVQA